MPEKSSRTRKRTPAPRPDPPAARPAAPTTSFHAAPAHAAPVPKAPAIAAPGVAAAAAAVTSTAPKTAISPEQRRRMVAEAAYYRAQRRGFRGDPVRDWTEAEAEIDAILLNR